MELNAMETPKQPPVRTISDFEDSVDYCFYLLGYMEGVRGVSTIVPEDSHEEAYSAGIEDGETLLRWKFLQAYKNAN